MACADTDEEAYELGRNWYWQLGTSFGIAPATGKHLPATSPPAQQGARQQERNATRQVNVTPGGPVLEYEQAQETYRLSPATPTP